MPHTGDEGSEDDATPIAVEGIALRQQIEIGNCRRTSRNKNSLSSSSKFWLS